MTQPVLSIDLDALAANWRALDELSGAAETGAAVKANGYGCGATEVTNTLAAAGCRSFFVATVEEGIAVRAARPDVIIYVLNGVTDRRDSAAVIAHGLRPCLNHPGQIDAWQRSEGGACAVQIDTGLSRLGLQPSEWDGVPEGLNAALLLSHLCCADEPEHEANAAQLSQFHTAAATLRDRLPQARKSLAATGGVLLGDAYHFDLVRCGIGIYGGEPFAQAAPVVSLETPILQIREISEEQGVGYSWTWRAEKPSRIGTLPLGYADGLHRALSNRASLYLNGKPVPIVGRVSMDLITVDLSDCPNAGVGDRIEVIGSNQTIDDLARAAGTIGYEILTSLGHRYSRRYTSASS